MVAPRAAAAARARAAPLHRPEAAPRASEARTRIDTLIADLDALWKRTREQSLSILVPMGQEMAYRFQEQLIADMLDALRAFRGRLAD